MHAFLVVFLVALISLCTGNSYQSRKQRLAAFVSIIKNKQANDIMLATQDISDGGGSGEKIRRQS